MTRGGFRRLLSQSSRKISPYEKLTMPTMLAIAVAAAAIQPRTTLNVTSSWLVLSLSL